MAIQSPVNDGYGWRDGGKFHNGIDIMAGYGSPIIAASSGIVTAASQDRGCGQYVMIGQVGDTGYLTFYHLHLEVCIDGSRVDPYS
ncbi:MAG: M23 family metallopeptidase [Actinomycetales bacterium]